MIRLSGMQVRRLLMELCVELGFCLPGEAQVRLENEPPLEVDAFVEAVYLAEGMAVPGDLRLWRRVKKKVAKHFRDAENDAGV